MYLSVRISEQTTFISPIQHQFTGFYSRDGECLLRGTGWIIAPNTVFFLSLDGSTHLSAVINSKVMFIQRNYLFITNVLQYLMQVHFLLFPNAHHSFHLSASDFESSSICLLMRVSFIIQSGGWVQTDS
jgi:hypothetical protein